VPPNAHQIVNLASDHAANPSACDHAMRLASDHAEHHAKRPDSDHAAHPAAGDNAMRPASDQAAQPAAGDHAMRLVSDQAEHPAAGDHAMRIPSDQAEYPAAGHHTMRPASDHAAHHAASDHAVLPVNNPDASSRASGATVNLAHNSTTQLPPDQPHPQPYINLCPITEHCTTVDAGPTISPPTNTTIPTSDGSHLFAFASSSVSTPVPLVSTRAVFRALDAKKKKKHSVPSQ